MKEWQRHISPAMLRWIERWKKANPPEKFARYGQRETIIDGRPISKPPPRVKWWPG